MPSTPDVSDLTARWGESTHPLTPGWTEDIATASANLSLFAHDGQHLFDWRGGSAKKAGIGAAQINDHIGGARNRESADGHGDEGYGVASRHQAVAEKEKCRPCGDDHDGRNGNRTGQRERHLQSRLADRVDRRFCRCERLRLLLSRRMERSHGPLPAAKVVERRGEVGKASSRRTRR